jgi:glucose/arabinose dehydrogenase
MKRLLAAAYAATTMLGAAWAAETVKKGPEAFGGWQQDKPGVRRLIKPEDLPQPGATSSAANSAQPIPMPEGAHVKLPPGFSATMIASGIENPRALRIAPNGDLFVANSKADQILVFRLEGGKVERKETFASGLRQPYGMAFHPPGKNPKWLYVANSNGVVRFPYSNDTMQSGGEAEEIIRDIPSAHHWTRDIAFSPDGKTLYLSVGSGSNVALDMSPVPWTDGGLEAWKKNKALGAAWDTEERRADILAFTPQGEHEKTFATGLRNCSGMTMEPGTGRLWCVVNERDELGDDTPFEFATEVKEGTFYGWPWFYIGDNEDPRHAGARPDLKDKVTVPDVMLQAHSAPLGIAFYDGTAFPDDYRGDAFVTMHGSWNRGTRTGYKVVRLIFDNGKPTGEYEDFMTGFVLGEDKVWGRPVGVAIAHDGSLIVSEDGNGTLWRVTYSSGNGEITGSTD